MKQLLYLFIILSFLSCSKKIENYNFSKAASTTTSASSDSSGGGIDVGNGMLGSQDINLLNSDFILSIPKHWSVTNNVDYQTDKRQFIHIDEDAVAEVSRILPSNSKESDLNDQLQTLGTNFEKFTHNSVDIYFDRNLQNYVLYQKSQGAILIASKNLTKIQQKDLSDRIKTVRSQALRDLEKIKHSLIEVREKIFYVDRDKFKNELTSETKLIRMLSNSENEDYFGINGSGTYYTFKVGKHDYGHGSDLRYDEGGYFSVGFAGCDFGYMTNIGLGEFKKINQDISNHSAYQYLYNLKINSKRYGPLGADFHHDQSSNGVEVGDQRYSDNLLAVVGHNYLIRSISFDAYDVLVHFKVLEIDKEDNSVILAYQIISEESVLSCNE